MMKWVKNKSLKMFKEIMKFFNTCNQHLLSTGNIIEIKIGQEYK